MLGEAQQNLLWVWFFAVISSAREGPRQHSLGHASSLERQSAIVRSLPRKAFGFGMTERDDLVAKVGLNDQNEASVRLDIVSPNQLMIARVVGRATLCGAVNSMSSSSESGALRFRECPHSTEKQDGINAGSCMPHPK
jgi:hypothetical protein